MMLKCQKLLEDTRSPEEQEQPSIILSEAYTQTYLCLLGVEVEIQTDPTPSFPAVTDEVNKIEELLDAASKREGSLEEIFRRSYKIVGVDPGIHSVRTTMAGTNVELILICSDWEKKGPRSKWCRRLSTIPQGSNLRDFVERT